MWHNQGYSAPARRRQLAAHVGADRIADAARLQPAQQQLLVEGAVAAQPHLHDPRAGRGSRSALALRAGWP
jgi:hypothetical protein